MEKENKLLIPIAILVAGALVAGAVFFKSKDTTPDANNDGTPDEIEVAPVSASDHVFGSPNAPITIIEYSDIDCPFCKDFHATMERIMETYGKDGTVSWVYRNFPLDSLHPEARLKAESAECVASLAGNDTYWKYLGTLFSGTETGADLGTIGATLGVNRTALESCIAAKTFAARVKADGDAALAAGGRGTPYSIVLTADGETFPLNGAQPYDVVKQVIDTILADDGSAQ